MALVFDPYAVLNVPRDATDDQIAQARHRLVRQYHPDVNHDPDAAARFDEVQRAFRLLSDPAARAEYDQKRAARPAGNPGRVARKAAPRVSIQPDLVDFGTLEQGGASADVSVGVYWTGAHPGLVTARPGSGWWRLLDTEDLAMSGVMFHLRAQAPVEAAPGRQHDQLRIFVDDTPIAIPVTAQIRERPPSSASGPSRPLPVWAWVLLVALLVVVVLIEILSSHSGQGSGSGAAAAATPASLLR